MIETGSDGTPGPPVALVVEDDPTLRAVLAYNLRREGYRVLEAADGPAGLAAAGRAGTRLVAVVLDLMLPGLDGLEVLRRLRADPSTRGAAVVVLTASTDEGARAAATAGGAAVVAKPFARADLLARVRAAAGARGPTPD